MPKRIPFQQVITALLDNTAVFPGEYLQRFSQLDKHELKNLAAAWPKIEPSRRRALLEDLEDLTSTDMLLMVDDVAILGLDDPEPGVRAASIRLLWNSEYSDLLPYLLRALENDPSPEVRAGAASAMGNFVYLGELEEIDADTHHMVEDLLLNTYAGGDEKLVRRRTLEALGFSSRPEVPALIQQAYDSGDPEWMASALFAMGRSYDKAWEAPVKRELNSPDGRVQLEAVRAAGELELDAARRALLDMLEDEGVDPDIRAAAIWSLSQIGGEQVRETLEELLDDAVDDDEEYELLQNALDNLELNDEINKQMDLFDIDLADKSHYTGVVDLEQDSLDDDEEEEEIEIKPDPDEAAANPPEKPKSPGRKRHHKHK